MSHADGKADPSLNSDAIPSVRANKLSEEFLKSYKKKRASAKGNITKLIKSLKKIYILEGPKSRLARR